MFSVSGHLHSSPSWGALGHAVLLCLQFLGRIQEAEIKGWDVYSIYLVIFAPRIKPLHPCWTWVPKQAEGLADTKQIFADWSAKWKTCFFTLWGSDILIPSYTFKEKNEVSCGQPRTAVSLTTEFDNWKGRKGRETLLVYVSLSAKW